MSINRERIPGASEPQRLKSSLGSSPPRLYEEYAYVLDYLQHGRTSADKPRHLALPTVQVIGENYFTLLEAEVRTGTQPNLDERVYIGKERREKINRIIGRIGYNDLTANAKAELLPVLEKLITDQEPRFCRLLQQFSSDNSAHARPGIVARYRKEIDVADNQCSRKENIRELQRH